MSALTLVEWAAQRRDYERGLFNRLDAAYFDAVLTVIADRDRLEALINTPELEDFAKALKVEAAHQQERWGVAHDSAKGPHDWAAVLVHLLGKAINAAWQCDGDKFKHHIVTIAAVCGNWHARVVERERELERKVAERAG